MGFYGGLEFFGIIEKKIETAMDGSLEDLATCDFAQSWLLQKSKMATRLSTSSSVQRPMGTKVGAILCQLRQLFCPPEVRKSDSKKYVHSPF